jgi:hypothetical protein
MVAWPVERKRGFQHGRASGWFWAFTFLPAADWSHDSMAEVVFTLVVLLHILPIELVFSSACAAACRAIVDCHSERAWLAVRESGRSFDSQVFVSDKCTSRVRKLFCVRPSCEVARLCPRPAKHPVRAALPRGESQILSEGTFRDLLYYQLCRFAGAAMDKEVLLGFALVAGGVAAMAAARRAHTCGMPESRPVHEDREHEQWGRASTSGAVYGAALAAALKSAQSDEPATCRTHFQNSPVTSPVIILGGKFSREDVVKMRYETYSLLLEMQELVPS